MEDLVRKLDLVSLRLFAAVCQEGSISRAAEREFITASAVSRRISEIEALVGLPLIHRHARGINVTPAGNAVWQSALSVADSIQELGAELLQFRSGSKGTVRVVANPSTVMQFLTQDIAAFARLFPDIDVELEEQPSPQAVRTIAGHGADFAICNEICGLDDFDAVPYRQDQLCVLLPKRHRLAVADSLQLAELTAEKVIGLKLDTSLMQLLKREYATLGALFITSSRAASLEAMCRMVHAGLGIAIVPKLVGEMYVDMLDVALRPLLAPWAIRQSFLICNGRHGLSATANALASFLTEGKHFFRSNIH
ncbi:LysR family transcriptional regulator [Pseudomonas vanderleydeniana]|uniref:LysR family transcriptional regulator n=1 Tax=Pseudomonas vanderleydeniana TaxID=2745495 RepID=A0A9E6PID7_9PSED|nr:LysR family transcriptional regulator [Pseudomonas vanderleydeniana]QXI27049.1 LysR family transcriptional regulator [Pseudomonas vanderleydeniana]